MSAIIALIFKHEYALSDNRKWGNMSAVIMMQLTEWDYAPAESQK